MKQIPALDKQFETRVATDHGSVLLGYANARKRNLDLMILDEFGLHAKSVPAIVESLCNHSIEQVAIMVPETGILDLLHAFGKTGATYVGDLVYTGTEDHRGNCAPGYIITLN